MDYPANSEKDKKKTSRCKKSKAYKRYVELNRKKTTQEIKINSQMIKAYIPHAKR